VQAAEDKQTGASRMGRQIGNQRVIREGRINRNLILNRNQPAPLRIGRWILLVSAVILYSTVVLAQGADPKKTEQANPYPQKTEAAPEKEPQTIFHHSDTARWWLSGQINIIGQGHGDFRALYSGSNSLEPKGEIRGSRIFTLFAAARLTNSSDVIFDLEEASGNGISNSLGLAGYTNIDVVRIPGQGTPLSTAPYMARAIFRYVFPLSSEAEESENGPLSMLRSEPLRRLEFRAGKVSLADFFDVNAVGSDSHLQFMNWTIVNNGAWDFAADTRGYTYAAMLEYDDRRWAIRFAEGLMPTAANSIRLDGDLPRARGENLELELHPHLIADRPTAVRLLSYVNHANMGDYREAVDMFREGRTPLPIIEDTRRQGRVKYGFGINLEQQLTANMRAFGRFGWNEGRHESFAYTEVNQTFSFGADYAGKRWRRQHDKAGLGFVSNAISGDHQEYLKLGGLGFLLGDGTLTYGRENIFEGYYNVHFWRGVYGAVDLQHITNPGYNRDRGPLFVPAVRLHIEL
jgi:high affinity Mn2+ porin